MQSHARRFGAVRFVLATTLGIAASRTSLAEAAPQGEVIGGVVRGQPSGTPRDRVPPVRTGTGAIRGRAVDALTGQPLARVRVRIMGSPGTRPSVLTALDGTFAFADLPAGQFVLSAEKSTYMATQYPERSRTLRGGARQTTLANGQVLENLVLPMYRGASISGRVFDAQGDPVEFAQVSVMRWTAGTGRPGMVASTQSNDLGEFRLARLSEGAYVVLVAPRRAQPEDYLPGAEIPPQPTPTFYPSTPALDQAQPLTLERGQSLTSIDIVLAEGAAVVVSGMVMRRDGEAIAGGYVNARYASRELGGGVEGGGGQIRPDGTFRMVLPPGDYVLQASVNARTPSGQPRAEQTGMARLTVGGSAVETVTIVVGSPATASGRVIFEGATPPPPPNNPMYVPFSSRDSAGCRAGQAHIGPDWSFKLDGLVGSCAAPGTTVFGRWTLKTVTYQGSDLLDRVITFEAGQHLANVQLVFTDRRSELVFRVTDDHGQPTREYVALVFPADKARWIATTPFVRPFVPLSQEQLTSAAQVRAVPDSARREALAMGPGDYYVVAVDDIVADEISAPALLERLLLSAERVTLGEGSSLEVTLKRVVLSDVR